MLFHDLETERLHLAGISASDREFILAQFSDGEVSRYLYDAEPMERLEEADELIGFYTAPEPRAQHRWILRLRESGEKIGTCGFHCWDAEAGRAEIGYDMQSAFWGRGLMSEALCAVLPFARDEMKLARLDAHIAVDNERSSRLALRHGFAFYGETLTLSFHGADYPHNVYTLRWS